MGELILRLINYFAAFIGFIALIMAFYGLFAYYVEDNHESKQDDIHRAKYAGIALALVVIYLIIQKSAWN